MAWIEIDENLYQNNIAPYFLQKIENEWYVVDSRDKSKFISFLDIFSNPVFPSGGNYPDLDFIVKNLIALNNITATNLIQALNINTTNLTVSNLIQALNITATNLIQALNITATNLIQALNITASETIRANHFRGENSNTPSTPSFSSQGDPNTGFYHISDGIFGFSSNGIQQGEFGNGYGGIKNNIIQLKTYFNDYQYTLTNIPTATETNLLQSAGTPWLFQFTPKMLNSSFYFSLSLSALRNVISTYTVYVYKNNNPFSFVRIFSQALNTGNVANGTPAYNGTININFKTLFPSYVLGDFFNIYISIRPALATNSFTINYGTLLKESSIVTIGEYYGDF